MYDKSRSKCFGFFAWLVTGDYIPPSGIATIYTLRRFYIFMRRTIISHFSFLISHSSEVFKCNQRNGTPQGLTLNPQPFLFSSLYHATFPPMLQYG